MDEIREGIINAEAEAGNLPETESASDPQCQERQNATEEFFQPSEPVPPRSFTVSQTVFAWVSLLAGYLFCRVFPVAVNPLGGFLFVLALFCVTAVILRKQGAVFSKMSVLSAVAAVTVSAALILSSNSLLHQVSYMFALATYGYFIYSATGNSLKSGFSDLILIDYLKALVVLPFCSFGHLFRAMFYGKAKSGGKLFGKTLLGIAIAFVPTVIVIVLLSYDDGFSEILGNIFDFNAANIASHIFSIGFGIPVGMYIFGLFVSSVDGDKAAAMNAEAIGNVSQAVRRMPAVTAFAAALPLIFVYVVFFISQWKYYVSGFSGVLPDDESYANYARDGFFQLCTVSVINLIAIIVLSVFMRRNDDGRSALLKILSVVYSVFTLVLISTAMAKMVMYIDVFGLTPKRVYASWFMVLLALVFILIIVRQFVAKLKIIVTSLAVCVVLFAALSLSNVDGLIAKYNVDRYLDGTLETVDVGALYDLGDAAVPEMVRLAEELDERLGTDVSQAIQGHGYNLTDDKDAYIYSDVVYRLRQAVTELRYEDDGGIFSYTVQKYRAENALEKIGAFD